jgi:hypothetical protein
MRLIAVLGIVFGAAVVLTCAVASAPASATVLCMKLEDPCKLGTYGVTTPTGGALPLKGSNEIQNGLSNVVCSVSQFSGEVTGAGGAMLSVVAPISAFTFDKCLGAKGETCTVKPVNMGPKGAERWGVTIQANNPSFGNGTVAVGANSLGLPGFSVLCTGVIDCTFRSSTLSFTLAGGPPAAMTASASMNLSGGAICPKNPPVWKAVWALTPNPLYLALE